MILINKFLFCFVLDVLRKKLYVLRLFSTNKMYFNPNLLKIYGAYYPNHPDTYISNQCCIHPNWYIYEWSPFVPSCPLHRHGNAQLSDAPLVRVALCLCSRESLNRFW